MRLSLPAPAKINRFLHIVGRREDGYHLLQTLFQFLDYGDQLHFECRDDNRIVLNPSQAFSIPEAENLIYRAAYALQQAAGTAQGVSIDWEKALPLGAGLGGVVQTRQPAFLPSIGYGASTGRKSDSCN